MSLAIKFGNIGNPLSLAGFIYLDAVVEYDKRFGGKITSHPIDSGASISDHYYSENAKFNVRGVVSGIDLSNIPDQLTLDNEFPLNVNQQPEAVTVNNFNSGLLSRLPASILQFVDSQQFTISGGGESRKNYKKNITDLLENVMTGIIYNYSRKRYENRMTPVRLYEMEGNQFADSYGDLVITEIRFSEGVDDWDALNIEIELEQARFVTLEKVDAPKTKKKGAQTTKNKGKVTAAKVAVPDVPKPDAPRPTVLGKIGEVVK